MLGYLMCIQDNPRAKKVSLAQENNSVCHMMSVVTYSVLPTKEIAKPRRNYHPNCSLLHRPCFFICHQPYLLPLNCSHPKTEPKQLVLGSVFIVDSSNTDLNPIAIQALLRSLFGESTISIPLTIVLLSGVDSNVH